MPDHAELDELTPLVFDAHCHLHLDQSDAGEHEAQALVQRLKGCALMSLEQSDWGRVAALSQRATSTRALFGIHPWRAHMYAGRVDWVDQLREVLQSHAGSAIGEIGLDRQWRPPETGQVEYEAQREVFQVQLALAAELDLPVSIHCVQAQGDLYSELSAAPSLPPAIYLHAFGGAAGTVEQLIRARRFGRRLYFGFATCVNLRSPKGRAAIAQVPEDRLLVESDRSSALPAGRNERELHEMLTLYAEVKGWAGGAEMAAARTAQNAITFYRVID